MKRKWSVMAHEKRAHLFPTYWYWKSVQLVGKIMGVPARPYACYYCNHEMSYVCVKKGFVEIGERILERLKLNDELIKKIEQVNEEEIPKLVKLSEWFIDNELSKVIPEEIVSHYFLVYDQFLKLMEYSAMGTVLEFEEPLLSNFLIDILKKKLDGKSVKVSEYFNTLTSPDRPTTSQVEEISLRNLKIKEIGSVLSDDDLQNYRANFSFIFFGYDGPSLTIKDVCERLSNLPIDRKILQEEIEELKNISQLSVNEIKKAEQALNLDDFEKYMFRVIRILGYWKFERKLACQKSHEMMEAFITYFTTKFNISRPQAKMIAPQEIREAVMENKINVDELNNRLKLSFALFQNYDEEKVVSSEGAVTLENEIKESLRVPKDVKEITGNCAYPGTAKGIVVRIDDELEMSKFEEGNIIVATSTTPKLIPIMKKAKAIVTDSGGITSHAAIVSRELKVPCIIGTKIASKILQDGDVVEIDATKGIIKKL